MNTITEDQYNEQLRKYIVSQMSTITENNHSLDFWAKFNIQCKEEFDTSLTAQGITVIG